MTEEKIPERNRKPYHERYYLLYGNENNCPDNIDPNGTLEFLKKMNLGENSLKQAREGKNLSALIESTNYEEAHNQHFCDFCGMPLTGTEYNVLADGRERCSGCSRTAVKTEEAFVSLFEEVFKNMELLFNIRFTAGIQVQMVNAKTLHMSMGKTFIPTGNPDPRILGVAINDKKGGFLLLVENGAPLMSSIKTMVHELTHIWQYQNWDANEIVKLYGPSQNTEIYEGMAKWVEVQYCMLMGEIANGKREELLLMQRDDEYGRGFVKYCSVYQIASDSGEKGATPFDNIHKPL